jgi:N-acetylmuramoyl-L-alanine amidase
VQQLLSTLGFKSGHVDGIHTAKTAEAITDFQVNAGLTPDGVCGSITLENLKRYGSNLKLGELASLQERDRFNSLGTQLNGKKIVLGETGGLDAIIASLRRSLGELGANVLTIHHPDASAQATQANTYGADLFIALEIRPERSAVCHFQGEHYLSPVGSLLAEKLVVELSQYFPDIKNKGMALRILRETQMPTVLCRFDSANTLVRSNQLIASSICTAINNALGKGFAS